MQTIQIGSFVVLFNWVVLAIAFLLGLVMINFWLRTEVAGELPKNVFDLFFNGLLLGLVIWKGSLILLAPSLVRKSIFSLLYFTGGTQGFIIAVFCSVLYYIHRAKRLQLPFLFIVQSLFIFSFAVISTYHLLNLFLLNGNMIEHIWLGVCSLVALIFSWRK